MLLENYPDLENFMTTWFNDAYDFDDLDEILDLMIRLDAVDNLVCLSKEVKRLERDAVSLTEINDFFKSIRVRRLTDNRYLEFKKKILLAAAKVGPKTN